MAFSSLQQGASATRCNPAGCKPEKNRNHRENKKPGSVGKSTLPGVEVAGFEPAAFWSRTKDSAAFSGSFRILPEFARYFLFFSGFCRLFPCFSVYFQTGLNRTFRQFPSLKVQPVRCNCPGCSMNIPRAPSFAYLLLISSDPDNHKNRLYGSFRSPAE